MVSVCCLTYNHEKYIRDALEGFVMQNTDFSYEVFVHDDASTDGTAAIIKEYAEKYPDIIKPILQEENQRSKGVKIISTYIAPLAKGKYIAYCEGDDFWCNSYKLQKQIEFLEAHPEYSACVHNTTCVNCVTGKENLHCNFSDNRTLETEEIIQYKWRAFHLSSVVHRKEFLIRPKAFYAKGFGDYPMAVYLSMVGKIYYFNDAMSVYRYLSNKNSWSYKHDMAVGAGKDAVIENMLNENSMLKEIDQYSEGKYRVTIDKVIRENEFTVLNLQGKRRQAYKEYKDVVRQMSKMALLEFMIKLYAPFVEDVSRFIRRKKYKKIIDKKCKSKEFS